MTTLSASTTFIIGSAPIAFVEAPVMVLAVPGLVTGKGRLVHPTLGTFDYPMPPDEWTNLDGDVIIPPIWESEQTLSSGQNTLWQGSIRDVVCVERWISEAAMHMPFLRQLISLYTNPPDPQQGYVLWYPSYVTSYGYKVVIRKVTVGGSEIEFNGLVHQGFSRGPVTLEMGVVDYAE